MVYAQQFFSACMPIFPFYAIMFMERGGLSTAQISLLFGAWTLTALISELPTGVLADRFSRRSIMVWGEVLIAVAFGIWILLPNFWGYGLGFIVWGLGYAMGSGAFQAYLYDELKANGAEKQFNRIYGRAESLLFMGAAVGFLGAIFIGATNYTALLAVSMSIVLLSAFLIYLYPKEPKTLPHPEETIRPKYLKMAFQEVRKSKIIARIVISTALVMGIVDTVDEYVPLYYNDIGVSNTAIPILMLIGMILSAILSWMAHRLEHTPVSLKLLLFGAAGGTLLVGSYQSLAFGVLGMLMFMRLGYLAMLLFESSLQHHITSKTRATLASLPTFIAEAITVALFGIYGITTYFGTDELAIRLLAGITIISALALYMYWGRLIEKDNPAASKKVESK